MLASLALAAIDGYRRHVSPRKGLRCAYGAWTGRGSCSTFGARAIEVHGLTAGLRLLGRRFRGCRRAAQALAATVAAPGSSPRPSDAPAGLSVARGVLDDLKGVGCCVAEVGANACWRRP